MIPDGQDASHDGRGRLAELLRASLRQHLVRFNKERQIPSIEKEAIRVTAAMSTYRRISASNMGRRSWLSVVLAVALALAVVAVAGAEARAGSFDDGFPEQLLKQGGSVLQRGDLNHGTWHWYEAGEWNTVFADYGEWPRAVPVGAGSRLRIRINKPERPAIYRIKAYNKGEHGWPIGKARHLDTTLRRIERNGKTVGWNVFFRVNRPDAPYFLETRGRWERVPGTHISYGFESLHFHVKTY
jgi:hypothetical protein